jgi:hypothetical protein
VHDGDLDQIDAGRFERFEEAAGEPQRNAIALPRPGPAAGLEAQQARLVERGRVEVREELGRGVFFADELAREHIAVAGPVLERDAPLPAGGSDGRARVGSEVAGALAGDRKGAVARQPLRPVLPVDAKPAAEDQRSESRAVDEEVAFDHLSRIEGQRLDRARLRIQRDVGDLAFRPEHSAAFRELAQMAGVQAGIEMVGVGIGRIDRVRVLRREIEAVGAAGGDGERQVFEIEFMAVLECP